MHKQGMCGSDSWSGSWLVPTEHTLECHDCCIWQVQGQKPVIIDSSNAERSTHERAVGCAVQADSDAVARKRGRYLLERAVAGAAEQASWDALLQLLGLLEDFALHLIKVAELCQSQPDLDAAAADVFASSRTRTPESVFVLLQCQATQTQHSHSHHTFSWHLPIYLMLSAHAVQHDPQGWSLPHTEKIQNLSGCKA